MVQKTIFFAPVLAAALLLLTAIPALAAEPAPVAVGEVRAEPDGGPNESLFTASVTGVPPGDGRYQVLLQLADTRGEFHDGDAKLVKPMVRESVTVWTAKVTVDKFARDNSLRYRAAVRDTASGTFVAYGQDQTLRRSGKAPPISRQEALDFLNLLASTYAAKNYAAFMQLVSPDFAGDDFMLSRAVRKDFQLLNDISIRFTIAGVTASGEYATVGAGYRRSVTPVRTGQRLNDSGMTEIVLIKEKGLLKLYSMKKPLLFGLAYGGAAATGTVSSGQNQNVTQIKRDGAVVVDPLPYVSPTPTVKTAVLSGFKIDGGAISTEALRLADGTKSTDNSRPALEGRTFDGDVAVRIGTADGSTVYYVYFTGTWQLLSGVTGMNSVTSVPASGYGSSYYSSLTAGTRFFAVHLKSGKYAVVEITNWTGNPGNWSVTVINKYQPDGTRNF